MDESNVSDLLPVVDFTIGNAELNAIEEINAKIRGLNTEQQEIFNFVHKWATEKPAFESQKRN